MGLHMGLDVPLATEASVLAILPQTHPLAVLGIGAGDVLVLADFKKSGPRQAIIDLSRKRVCVFLSPTLSPVRDMRAS